MCVCVCVYRNGSSCVFDCVCPSPKQKHTTLVTVHSLQRDALTAVNSRINQKQRGFSCNQASPLHSAHVRPRISLPLCGALSKCIVGPLSVKKLRNVATSQAATTDPSANQIALCRYTQCKYAVTVRSPFVIQPGETRGIRRPRQRTCDRGGICHRA